MATQPQEPGPIQRAPEWVGDDDVAVDVARVSDRQVAIMALDKILRLTRAVGRLSDRLEDYLNAEIKSKEILLRELPDHGRRIVALEVHVEHARAQALQASQPPKPADKQSAVDDDEMQPEESSYHNVHEMMAEAGDILYRRMKDPRDRMDSDRVRQITSAVLESAKNAEDAASFRKLKKGSKKVALEVAKHFLRWVLPLLVGGGAVHWGLHHGQMPAQERAGTAASPAAKP